VHPRNVRRGPRADLAVLALIPVEPTRRTALWWLALIAIAVAGLVGRAWNLDFDDRQHQHPDERHWAMTSADLAALEREAPASGHGTVFGPVLDWLDADVSPANPYRVKESFVYGSAPLAWARGLASWMRDGVDHGTWPAGMVVDGLDALGVPLLHPDGTARFDAGYDVDLVGRVLGVAFDTITIVLVGLIGRRLAGRHTAGPAVGLVAAVLYAACPLMLQATHFLSSEPALALASAATLLAALRLDRSADRAAAARGGALLGACSGVAVAIKLSALPLVVVPLAGCCGSPGGTAARPTWFASPARCSRQVWPSERSTRPRSRDSG